METYKENEEIFKGYQHQSVLDSRTTLQCAVVDGAFYDLNFKGINEKGKQHPYKPVPRHFRCRSIILPILRSYKELGIDLDEVTGLTRSSIDGELPRDVTFDKFFERQSKKFQEEYLGAVRYKLFKDGKITLSDLVNQQGKTLTIEELKEKYS